jgi:hypothetical protein
MSNHDPYSDYLQQDRAKSILHDSYGCARLAVCPACRGAGCKSPRLSLRANETESQS